MVRNGVPVQVLLLGLDEVKEIDYFGCFMIPFQYIRIIKADTDEPKGFIDFLREEDGESVVGYQLGDYCDPPSGATIKWYVENMSIPLVGLGL